MLAAIPPAAARDVRGGLNMAASAGPTNQAWPATLPGTPVTPPLNYLPIQQQSGAGAGRVINDDRAPDWAEQVQQLIDDGVLPPEYLWWNPWQPSYHFGGAMPADPGPPYGPNGTVL